MLKEEVWLSIAKKDDILCPNCIEKKLGRNIVVNDFKLGVFPVLDYKIPCNMIFAEIKGIKY